MKYTEDGVSYGWSSRFEKENPNKVPIARPVWGFAYKIDNETGYKHLSCLPELGEVLEEGDIRLDRFKLPSYANKFFIPYKKGTEGFRKSGIVRAEARYYADTYEEAVEGYNSLVLDRMARLDEMAQECMEDLLRRGSK